MSFILDALKKSELERQRQTIPGLVDPGAVRPRSKLPAWGIAVCALLAVNVLVLTAVLLRSWINAPVPAPPSPAQSMPGDSARPPKHTAADNDHFSPLGDAPVYAPEIPVTDHSTAGIAPTGAPGANSMVAEAPPPAAPAPNSNRAPRRRDPVLTSDDSKTSQEAKVDDDEVLPSINEVSLSGAQALPELHLDVHVFATRAADRFVYINMRKYHEGATLEEGPTVERIRRDGVVLGYQGLRFLLPRQ